MHRKGTTIAIMSSANTGDANTFGSLAGSIYFNFNKKHINLKSIYFY